MALTKTRLITLHQVLGVPYQDSVYRIQDNDNMLALRYYPQSFDHLARLQISQNLTTLEANDPDAFADLEDLLDRWYCLLGDSTSMEGGGVGNTVGVSFNLVEERNMLRERIVTIISFSRDKLMDEMRRTQKADMSVSVIR